jgi:serine/threonine-protein kinase
VTGGLGHPHIVQVFDFSTTPTGQPFLVMELLEGEDLDHRLRRVGRLLPADVVRIVRQVASALAAAQDRSIVHRDLKPANVFLMEAKGEVDFVKVLDFGISKVLASTTKITKTSSVVGSPTYMSPEQAEGKIDEIDERTDQWALACIAWECLSGVSPFVGDSVPSILYQVVHGEPSPLVGKLSGAYPQVEAVLLRALAKNKKDRFGSVNEFAVALESAVGNARSVARAPVSPTVLLPGAPSPGLTTLTVAATGMDDDSFAAPPSRPKWHWVLAVLGVVTLLVGALGLLRVRPIPTPTPTGPVPGDELLPSAASPPTPARAPDPVAVDPARLAEPASEPASEPFADRAHAKAKAKAEATELPPDPVQRKRSRRAARAQAGQTVRPSGPLNDDL